MSDDPTYEEQANLIAELRENANSVLGLLREMEAKDSELIRDLQSKLAASEESFKGLSTIRQVELDKLDAAYDENKSLRETVLELREALEAVKHCCGLGLDGGVVCVECVAIATNALDPKVHR